MNQEEFEKRFPSLKGRGFTVESFSPHYCDDGWFDYYGDDKVTVDYNNEDIDLLKVGWSPENVKIKDIVENCLDKQKVKESIDKLTEYEYGADSEYFKALMDLEKELGLSDGKD